MKFVAFPNVSVIKKDHFYATPEQHKWFDDEPSWNTLIISDSVELMRANIVKMKSNKLIPGYAIKNASLDTIKFFVEELGVEPNRPFVRACFEVGSPEVVEWILSKLDDQQLHNLRILEVSCFDSAKLLSGHISLLNNMLSAVKVGDKRWIDWCFQKIDFITDYAIGHFLFVGRVETVIYVVRKLETLCKKCVVQKNVHKAFRSGSRKVWKYVVENGYELSCDCYETASRCCVYRAYDFLKSHGVQPPNKICLFTCVLGGTNERIVCMKAQNDILKCLKWLEINYKPVPQHLNEIPMMIGYKNLEFLHNRGIVVNPIYHEAYKITLKSAELYWKNIGVWKDEKDKITKAWVLRAISNKDLVLFAYLVKNVGADKMANVTVKLPVEFQSWLRDNNYLN